jgi:hypothetical protein
MRFFGVTVYTPMVVSVFDLVCQLERCRLFRPIVSHFEAPWPSMSDARVYEYLVVVEYTPGNHRVIFNPFPWE